MFKTWTYLTSPLILHACCFVASGSLLMPSASIGQQFGSSSLPTGIVANGSSEMKLEPQRLRLRLQVQAQGKDAKSAIKSLTAHKERVRKSLIEMNADPDSIQFASTHLSSGDNSNSEQRQYMQMMRMMQRQMGGAEVDTGAVPTVYTATSRLTAEWPLPTKDPDALAILPQGLKDQVASRDLAGKENKPDLSEEQLERLQEMQSSMDDEYGLGMTLEDSSEPTIVFVGRTSDDQRRDVMRKAFQAARQSAVLTAQSLDAKLKDLKTAWPYEDSRGISVMSSYMGYDLSDDGDSGEDDDDVITAATADGLKLEITVMTVYDFE